MCPWTYVYGCSFEYNVKGTPYSCFLFLSVYRVLPQVGPCCVRVTHGQGALHFGIPMSASTIDSPKSKVAITRGYHNQGCP